LAILPGARLGPFEILAPVGAGGMGEVYKARDTRLNRIVAIKVLPTHLADRADLRERFEREARTIASLNHPHICTLYDTGHQDGTDFLVMEYLEGETLAHRLMKGPLPLDQVLQYAVEIADALDKAHRKGITHRDLKPGNIMTTKSGTKLLDFGLAKLKQDGSPAAASLSQLPTETHAITAEGTILGTVQYMAPEQVEGKEVDARTDIFAFGVVIYEMATGKKAFEGKTSASIMAKILESNPAPMASLQPVTPPALDYLVKRCLAKDPDERWQSAGDMCQQLKWISDSGLQAGVIVPAASKQKLKNRVAWAGVAIAIAVAIVGASTLYLRRAPPAEKQAVRFTVGPPEKGSFTLGTGNRISVSPDGSKLVFVAAAGSSGPQLWIRALDSSTAQPLPGTENATYPFWSPDGRFLGFSAGGRLKKISVSGGPVQTLSDVPGDGGAWSREGIVLFTPVATPWTIHRVAESGGTATPVTTLDSSRSETAHLWPQFLPDGKHFLYYGDSAKLENSGIYVASLDSKERKLLVNAASNLAYVSPGYLLFHRQGTLLAQPFDAGRLQLSGEAIPIVEGVEWNPFGPYATFAASDNGVLAYRGGGGAVPLTLVWVSRNGTEQALAAPPHNYVIPRISPDGNRIAAGIEDGVGEIWIYDIPRDALTRLTFDGAGSVANVDPVWTPDGKRIVFKGKRNRLFWQPADGGGGAEQLTSDEISTNDIPGSWSPDGQELVLTENRDTRKIWILPLKDRKPHLFVEGSSYETAPCFSPDGRWIAYSSNDSGRYEIYVRPYPGPGGKWQISNEGGTEPVWNPKGHELFYRNGKKMMAVDFTAQPTFSPGKPRMLFEGPYVPTPRSFADYDVSPDGQRFLMLKAAEQTPGQINVVLNWTEELKRRAPAGK
jgi:serine/threonine protein kinase